MAKRARVLVMMGNPHHAKPYRVEWRANLTTQWVLLQSCDTHGDALEVMEREEERLGGQARVLTQHVVAVKGLAAEAFANDT